MKFQVGDRVNGENGKGIIKGIDGKQYAVEFVKSFHLGHSCDGLTHKNHGWWQNPNDLTLIERRKTNV